ncbi:MAG: decaprenyl-phosphate phosphoribosyltransferase, partial [Gallionella sp.]
MHTLLELLRLMRPQQWVKNGFVFTGLLFGHEFNDSALVLQVIVAALAFSLVSSAIYIINDIADREQDRMHPKKKHRPLAAGTVSIKSAVTLSGLLAIVAIALAYSVSEIVLWIIIGYGLMNLAYSFRLKHVVLLDVFIIAAGFMLRILAGTSGVDIPPSQWLLLCGLMVTLFLGFAKRRAEIIALTDDKTSHRKVLEHYSPVMLDNMIGVTAAGLIMSYSLYTMSSET